MRACREPLWTYIKFGPVGIRLNIQSELNQNSKFEHILYYLWNRHKSNDIDMGRKGWIWNFRWVWVRISRFSWHWTMENISDLSLLSPVGTRDAFGSKNGFWYSQLQSLKDSFSLLNVNGVDSERWFETNTTHWKEMRRHFLSRSEISLLC